MVVEYAGMDVLNLYKGVLAGTASLGDLSQAQLVPDTDHLLVGLSQATHAAIVHPVVQSNR